MSSHWLEDRPFHSVCFLTFQGMCVALLGISFWSWVLGSHILLPGVFTAVAPWNGCKECWAEWEDLLISGLFLYSVSIKKHFKTYNSNTSRSPQPCQTQMLWLLIWMWGECGLCDLAYHSLYSLSGEKISYVIQAFPSSFFLFLHSNVPYLLIDCAYVSSWCGAAGADSQRWLLVLRTWYVRGFTSDCLRSGSWGCLLGVGEQEVYS